MSLTALGLQVWCGSVCDVVKSAGNSGGFPSLFKINLGSHCHPFVSPGVVLSNRMPGTALVTCDREEQGPGPGLYLRTAQQEDGKNLSPWQHQ